MVVTKRTALKYGGLLRQIVREHCIQTTMSAYAYRLSKRAPTRKILLTRKTRGAFANHIKSTLWFGSNADYKSQFGLNKREFNELYFGIASSLQKKPKGKKKTAISGLEKLALTLNYLKSGATMTFLKGAYLMSLSAMQVAIKKVLHVIVGYIEIIADVRPQSTSCWKRIADRFYERWQMPHCLGALDGKHVWIRKFGKTGSSTINYHGWPSLVLLAVSDADYRIIHFNVGTHGGRSDGGIWTEDRLGFGLSSGILDNWIPKPSSLPRDFEGKLGKVNYFIVADEAFTMNEHLIKPYTAKEMTKLRRYTNYRISRARMVIECVFGHLTRRFRILQHINTCEEVAILTVKACVHLHNFIRTRRLQSEKELQIIENPPEEVFGTRLEAISEEDEEEEFDGGSLTRAKIHHYVHNIHFFRRKKEKKIA